MVSCSNGRGFFWNSALASHNLYDNSAPEGRPPEAAVAYKLAWQGRRFALALHPFRRETRPGFSTFAQPCADWMRGTGMSRCIDNQGALPPDTRRVRLSRPTPRPTVRRLDTRQRHVPLHRQSGSLAPRYLRVSGFARRHQRPAPCRAGLAAGARPLHSDP